MVISVLDIFHFSSIVTESNQKLVLFADIGGILSMKHLVFIKPDSPGFSSSCF